jgi:hypothetical protein
VTFFSDFAAGSVHATLNPLSTTSTPFPSDRKGSQHDNVNHEPQLLAVVVALRLQPN